MGTASTRFRLVVPLAAGDEEATFEVDSLEVSKRLTAGLPVRLTVLSVDGSSRSVEAQAVPVDARA